MKALLALALITLSKQGQPISQNNNNIIPVYESNQPMNQGFLNSGVGMGVGAGISYPIGEGIGLSPIPFGYDNGYYGYGMNDYYQQRRRKRKNRRFRNHHRNDYDDDDDENN